MRNKGSKGRLPSREARALACIQELSKEGLDPSATAVALVLRGDYGAERFSYLKTHGTLRSLSLRKIKSMLTLLRKKGFLSTYTPPPFLESYLYLSEAGAEEATAFLSKVRSTPSKTALPPLFNERK